MKRSSQESQARLFEIAQSQGGYFTAKQAEDAGFTRTNHAYHVETQNWQREYRGIFRLTRFPMPEHRDLIMWSLWSRDRKDNPQGVFSHQAALAVWDLSDLMPAKLHMTVPVGFRRSAIPDALVLHYANLDPDTIEEREGFRITRPMQTILDLIESNEVSDDIIEQAFTEARQRGISRSDNSIEWSAEDFKVFQRL
jgi:predicted transcriptional regulator of viral defense system